MNNIFMVDQAPRHEVAPDSLDAKLARAKAYLSARGIEATAKGSTFRYTKSEFGSTVLRELMRKAA